MSGLPSESLWSGGLICPYFPHCEAEHGVLQCERLALMAKEHKRGYRDSKEGLSALSRARSRSRRDLRPVRESPHNRVRTEAVGGAVVETRVDYSPSGQYEPGLL